jgi:hypothetical protein
MTVVRPIHPHRKAFFTVMAVVTGVSVFVGFARSYYLKEFFGTRTLPPLLHLHGLIFSAWIILFLIQTVLIQKGEKFVHRRLGIFGGFLALSMILVGLQTGVARARVSANPPRLLILALGDIFMFTPLIVAGIYWRNRVETHKRLMLLATISIVDAGTGRWPIWAWFSSDVIVQLSLAYAVRDLFIIAAMIYDKRIRGSVHPVYLWAGLPLIASDPIRLLVFNTHAWRAFTSFLTGINI